MIKKNKDCYKQIADEISKALEWNKTHTTLSARINLQCLKISKGLWGMGSIAIRDKVCAEMNIKPWDTSFQMKVYFDEVNEVYELRIKYEMQ